MINDRKAAFPKALNAEHGCQFTLIKLIMMIYNDDLFIA
jgi:hypothetical protein